MNCIRRILPAALLAAPLALATGQANAQVDVDVNITLQGIVILDYYSTINVTIPSSELGDLFTGCGESVTAGSACDQGIASATAALEGANLVARPTDVPVDPPGTALNAVPLVLEDVWAVRAIATNGTGTVNVGITAGTQPLNNGAANITITGATVSDPSFAAPGLVSPFRGDVTLILNLTNATRAGEYSSSDGEDYTLDVTLI